MITIKRNFALMFGSLAAFVGAASTSIAAVVAVSGSVAIETSPYPLPSDTQVFVFDEQTDVAFVASQPLDFGSIAPGTCVNSHYVQFDPASPTSFVGLGTMTFDGPILGIITITENLNADLNPDVPANSDTYFGLEATLGLYPTGDDPGARGLGSAEDDLIIVIGSPTLTVDSLEVPVAGNLDGFRVFTACVSCPADIDGNGAVGFSDLSALLSAWGPCGAVCPEDISGDGQVGFADLSALLNAWGPCS